MNFPARLEEKRDFHTPSARKFNVRKTSAAHLLTVKNGYCVSLSVTEGLCMLRLSLWDGEILRILQAVNIQQAFWKSLLFRLLKQQHFLGKSRDETYFELEIISHACIFFWRKEFHQSYKNSFIKNSHDTLVAVPGTQQ